MKHSAFYCLLILALLFLGCGISPTESFSEESSSLSEIAIETTDSNTSLVEDIIRTESAVLATTVTSVQLPTTRNQATTPITTTVQTTQNHTTQTSTTKSISFVNKSSTTIHTQSSTGTTTSKNSVAQTTSTNGETPVREVRMDEDCVTLSPNQTYQAMAIISPYTATNQSLTWDSSDSAVATVDNRGLITAVWEGFTMITATTHNGLSAIIGVYVNVDIEDKCDLEIPPLPYTLHHYDYKEEIISSFLVTDINYSFKESYTDGTVDLTLSFAGEKTFDIDGEENLKTAYICWRLFDSEGYLVDSGTYYVDDLCVGEKVRNCEEKLYNLKPDAYRLELIHRD